MGDRPNQKTQSEDSNKITIEGSDSAFLMKLDCPWKILKNGTKLGIGGFKRFLIIVLLFVMTNIVLLGFGIYRVAVTRFSWGDMGMLLLTALLGLLFIVWAGYKSYRYIAINVMAKIYQNSHWYLQGMYAEAVTRTEQLFSNGEPITDIKLKALTNWGNSAYGFYERVPVFFQSGITQLLYRVPITAFLVKIKEGEKQLAAEKLYALVDNFINVTFFSKNNTRWLLWLLPLDVTVMIAVAIYGIG